MSDIRHEEMVALAERMVDRILHLEKGMSFEAGGHRFYPSEIHVLLRAAAAGDAGVTRLAAALGLTKGAVSQTLSRLEHKGALVKSRGGPGGELSLALTPSGEAVVSHFKTVQASMRRDFDAFFAGLSAGERAGVERFLRWVSERYAE